ncbi:MAG: aldo/keto reductase [Planctomycetota bacterium]|jgi:aryl-alcohol dehydrogenase-like predicted oxidoreductase
MLKERVTRREFVHDTAAAAAGAAMGAGAISARADDPDPTKTRSYNENMEYRRLGRTGLMLSVLSMGGHWKKMPFKRGSDEFKKNRREVIHAALDHGVNYIDACCAAEVKAYAEALGSRREEIYFGFDWTLGRKPEIVDTVEPIKKGLDDGLRETGLEYVDVWRITLREQTTRNTQKQIENVMKALAWGKKSGKARFTGVSTHHRPWIAEAVAKYPQLEVIITPYSAGSKEKPVGSMFDAFRQHDVGMVGIKPFAGGTLFQSRGEPDSATKEEDNRRARMALRHVLCCDVLTAAIPGLITVDQVKNAARAVKERRQLDLAETKKLEEITRQMWNDLPEHYGWLRDWEWV